jgi:hypothetical protein
MPSQAEDLVDSIPLLLLRKETVVTHRKVKLKRSPANLIFKQEMRARDFESAFAVCIAHLFVLSRFLHNAGIALGGPVRVVF